MCSLFSVVRGWSFRMNLHRQRCLTGAFFGALSRCRNRPETSSARSRTCLSGRLGVICLCPASTGFGCVHVLYAGRNLLTIGILHDSEGVEQLCPPLFGRTSSIGRRMRRHPARNSVFFSLALSLSLSLFLSCRKISTNRKIYPVRDMRG